MPDVDLHKTVAYIIPVEPPTNPRIPNMFPDIWVSDDFDAPQPDEFWLVEKIEA